MWKGLDNKKTHSYHLKSVIPNILMYLRQTYSLINRNNHIYFISFSLITVPLGRDKDFHEFCMYCYNF